MQSASGRRAPLETLSLYRQHNGTIADLIASRAAYDPARPFLTCPGFPLLDLNGPLEASCANVRLPSKVDGMKAEVSSPARNTVRRSTRAPLTSR